MHVFKILHWNYIRKLYFVEQGFLVYIYHIRIHNCFGCHYCIAFSNTVTPFLSWEEAFVVVALRNSFSESGEGRNERVCIVFVMYLITSLRFAFLIRRCARCFHGTFSQINFCHFSGEALSLPSAFVYFAVMRLLVPAACKNVKLL